MATFKDLQDRINLDYINRTDMTSETKRAIVRAVKHYERSRTWFNQTATAINAATTSYTLSLPADLISVDMVTYTVNAGSPQFINQRTYERVTYQNQGGTSGVPQECAVFNSKLYLYPKPSSAFPVTVNYTFRYPVLSADADNNPWLDEAEDLIVYHAAADMLQNVIRNRPNDVQAMQQLEAAALQSFQQARNLHMNTDEDLSLLGPQQRQDPTKTDGSKTPNS